MSLLPDISGGSGDFAPNPRQAAAAARAQRGTEMQIFRHELGARLKADCDRVDSQAAADAMRAALDEELELLDYGLRRAQGSAAKAELVARKIEMLAASNNRRISRRFGG